MNITSSQLAKIVIKMGWVNSPSSGIDYEFRQAFPNLDSGQISKLHCQVMDSGLIQQEQRKKGWYSVQYRYVLADGITEEML